MIRHFVTLLLLHFSLGIALSQQPTQTIRGLIADESSGVPLPTATVVILNIQPVMGTVADSTGIFKLTSVPVGRHDLQVTIIGYEPVFLREVLVLSGRETFLTVTMRESTTQLGEVLVKPNILKEKPLNAMSMVSARMLSVDEASRFAGGFDDPARLAASFAGVASNVGNNGIVVRGNSPKSLQWKMEGVEIPNPNHFADMSALGGGGLTALSVKMLANSDFFTGAFPAEYHNALSGVFDVMMRNGNNQQHEHSVQVGVIGVEASSEGPLNAVNRSSYLVNYRYSTLGLLAPLLPANGEGVTYQDVSFKMNFPTKRLGIFKLWGIGLADGSGQIAKVDSLQWKYNQDKETQDVDQMMAAGGLSHQYFINNRAYVKTNAATTIDRLDLFTRRLSNQMVLQPANQIRNSNQTFVFSSFINQKLNTRHTNRTGFVATGMRYNLLLKDQTLADEPLSTIVDEQGFSTLLSAFTNSSLKLGSTLIMTLGANAQFFTLNRHYTVEPRAAIRWQMAPTQSLAIAYGLHSRLEKLNYYFNTHSANDNTLVNRHLDFAKAHHWVMSYDQLLSDQLHLKAELYYQHLYNVPVVSGTSFSFINLQNDWFFNQKLANQGLGRNYGLDLTLERYLNQGFYYLLTASLFNSEYRGGDHIWRNTRFNRYFLFNILTGKEWQVGALKQNTFGASIRLSYQGGDCYSPVDNDASQLADDVVFDESRAFSCQLPDSFTGHFTVSFRINKIHTSHEIAIKCLNATMQDEFTDFQYNHITQQVDQRRDVIFIPNLSYKVEF